MDAEQRRRRNEVILSAEERLVVPHTFDAYAPESRCWMSQAAESGNKDSAMATGLAHLLRGWQARPIRFSGEFNAYRSDNLISQLKSASVLT